MKARGIPGPSTATNAGARAAAEALAVEALSFLGTDPDRLERFLSLCGLSVANLRQAAAEPGFLTALLDHLASDESLLLAFAAQCGRDPAEIGRARTALAPPADFS